MSARAPETARTGLASGAARFIPAGAAVGHSEERRERS